MSMADKLHFFSTVIKRLACKLTLPVLLLFIYSCKDIHAREQPRETAVKTVIDSTANNTATAWNKRMIDSAITLLRSGDLVLRTGIDVSSYMLRQMNQKDKTYSHCGIVMIEHGYPFIYHSIGGEDNPDARLRRDSASFFFSPLNNFGFGLARYDMTESQVNKLRQTVLQYYKEGRKFDLNFDLKTDDRLYCAEFVYKAVRVATDDTAYLATTSIFGYTFAGVDDLFMNKHTRLLWQVKYK
jgi:hypothetical protein